MRICPRGALLGCSHKDATLPCVTDQEIELHLVYDQPPCQHFFVSHAAVGKFADNRAGSSIPSVNQTSVCLPKEKIASLTLRVFSKPDSKRNTKSSVGAQPASAKCLPNQAGMTGSPKLPFLDLSEACTYVPGEGAIDGYTGHMVGRMPKPLKIGFRFTHSLEGCRIAGFHIDAADVPRFQGFFSLAIMLARGFLRRLFRRARGCLIWRRSLGVFREPLVFDRCGRPAAQTGRLRAVCHGRPGASPLTANCGWHHGSSPS